MKRFALLAVSVLALAFAAATATAAADGSYGPWEPITQRPITAPAGVVCPFTVTAEPVAQKLKIRYHYDDAGNVDGYQVTGPLTANITNEETGASVQRNLSGLGTVTLYPDGSYDATIQGGLLVFFLAGDTPANELLFVSGNTVLHGAPSGAKLLVSVSGSTEDLCQTLA